MCERERRAGGRADGRDEIKGNARVNNMRAQALALLRSQSLWIGRGRALRTWGLRAAQIVQATHGRTAGVCTRRARKAMWVCTI